jgi:hypothetical protein
MSKDVTPETLVVNPKTGEVESSLSSLMNAGLIRETADGWELAGPDGKFATPSKRASKAAGEDSAEAGDKADDKVQEALRRSSASISRSMRRAAWLPSRSR